MKELTTENNRKTVKRMIRDWHLGPEKASANPKANPSFWQSIAKIWKKPVSEARRQWCANCEYFDNTPEQMKRMEVVPYDKFDADGGGRGYCTKFDIICHNLRVCQAWEKKPYETEEKEEPTGLLY